MAINLDESLLMKFDENWHLLWNQTLPALPIADPFAHTLSADIAQANDGGYFIAGLTMNNDNVGGVLQPNLWLVKTDKDRHTQFSKSYNFDNSLGGKRANHVGLDSVFAVATKDGGYLLAGEADFTDYLSPFLVKLDSYGNWQWHHTYATSARSSVLNSVLQTADGGFLIAGAYYTPSYNSGSYNQLTPLLFKTDSFGNVLWNQSFSSTEDYHFGYISSVLVTKDDGYAVLDSLDNAIWLAKITPESVVSSSEFFTTAAVAIVSGVIVVVLIAGFLVYFKKRKHHAVP